MEKLKIRFCAEDILLYFIILTFVILPLYSVFFVKGSWSSKAEPIYVLAISSLVISGYFGAWLCDNSWISTATETEGFYNTQRIKTFKSGEYTALKVNNYYSFYNCCKLHSDVSDEEFNIHFNNFLNSIDFYDREKIEYDDGIL